MAGAGGGAAGRRKGRRGEPEPTPLGSLSQAGQEHAPGTGECEAWGATPHTPLPRAQAAGTDVTFVSCHECEHRAWFPLDGDGTSLSRDEVVRRSSRG